MTRMEANLVREDERFVNQALLSRISDRILESIKGKRRNARYKAVVADYLCEEKQPFLPQETINGSQKLQIILHIRDLSAITSPDNNCKHLLDIYSAISSCDEHILQELSLYPDLFKTRQAIRGKFVI